MKQISSCRFAIASFRYPGDQVVGKIEDNTRPNSGQDNLLCRHIRICVVLDWRTILCKGGGNICEHFIQLLISTKHEWGQPFLVTFDTPNPEDSQGKHRSFPIEKLWSALH